ncbi:thioesterase-like superfamily-domain-containing protein [Gongronella butleri]|nr:thioesterase-like superfamily-domain-containing protein [Gongronella butleri]
MASLFDKGTHVVYLGKSSWGTHIFAGEVSKRFALGNAPLGGYTSSIALAAVLEHFTGKRQQDPVAMNTFFLRKTEFAPVIVEVQDLKMSRRGYCTSQVTLKQCESAHSMLQRLEDYDAQQYVSKVMAVVTMGNMDDEKGITNYHKLPPCPALDTSRVFVEGDHDLVEVGKVCLDAQCIRKGALDALPPEIHEIIAFQDGRQMDAKAMAFFCDMLISPPNQLGERVFGGPLWCPTMQMEIVFKRRFTAKDIQLAASYFTHAVRDNRFDIDGWLWTMDGELVATTRHQCLAIPRERKVKNGASKL